MISSTSVLVITAIAAIAPPRPSDPVSPMKIEAGNELNHRKPMQAPPRQAGTGAGWGGGVVKVIEVKTSSTRGPQRGATPSSPSVRLTADVVPASTRLMK